MNMKAFMKPELKERGTMQFPGIDKFVDEKGEPIPFIIKRMSALELKEIRNRHKTKEVYRDRKNGGRPVIGANGQVAVLEDYDAAAAGLEIMVEAFVQPKLDDSELMEFYGVYDRLEMPQTLFSDKADFEYANQCLMAACGMSEEKDENKVVDKLKN